MSAHPVSHLMPGHRAFFITTYTYHTLPHLLTNRNFSHCQEIRSNLARVSTKSSNLFLARKNASILRLCILLIISDLQVYK